MGDVCLIFLMLRMSEKLCLQWNDFKENIISSVGNLREDQVHRCDPSL